jgi:hypothetical protein
MASEPDRASKAWLLVLAVMPSILVYVLEQSGAWQRVIPASVFRISVPLWAIVGIFGYALVVTYLLARQKGAASRLQSTQQHPPAPSKPSRPQYEPSQIEADLIRTLRHLDAEAPRSNIQRWSAESAAKDGRVPSSEEYRVGFDTLIEHKWVDWKLGRSSTTPLYFLTRLGLDYARKQGFETMAQIEAKKT